MKNKPLVIGNTVIQPGERLTLGLPTPELSTYTSMHIPIHVMHGKKEGPCLLVCSAIHGDEMNGISIIHKLLSKSVLKTLRGTLIAVPALNVYGLMTLTRNLPDRRDLDGSFPGLESGSFAARLAHYFTEEILSKATHCIDIHTAEPYQCALPQIQTNLDVPGTEAIAKAFQPYVVVHTRSERGLLWQNSRNIPTLIYEAGEPLRLDEKSIRIGFRGILRVMHALEMIKLKSKSEFEPVLIRSRDWLRSPGSGLCQLFKKLGAPVKKGEVLADIFDPFGTSQTFQIQAPASGIIMTQNTLPLVNEGDPIVQIAQTEEEVSQELWDQNLEL
ncbi:MAG: N-alpha-acetyl-L-2,4-diaminobutyric acid deacetylase [Chlamydiales bacterium]|nr:N-alpha-acetyl-L-2,4-diaminobutyric acid deacetylase [Chlamydiales bacterium]